MSKTLIWWAGRHGKCLVNRIIAEVDLGRGTLPVSRPGLRARCKKIRISETPKILVDKRFLLAVLS